jgi:hypothetical protein
MVVVIPKLHCLQVTNRLVHLVIIIGVFGLVFVAALIYGIVFLRMLGGVGREGRWRWRCYIAGKSEFGDENWRIYRVRGKCSDSRRICACYGGRVPGQSRIFGRRMIVHATLVLELAVSIYNDVPTLPLNRILAWRRWFR